MTTLYVSTEGAIVRLVDERLTVVKDKERLADMPLHKLESVVLFTSASITPAAMQALAERRIDLCFTNYYGRFFARLQPSDSAHVRLRRAQYRALDDESLRLKIARAIVIGKLNNQRIILLRARRSDNITPEKAKLFSSAIERMRQASRGARLAATLDEVRGHEGAGAATYFSVFNEMILNPDFSFSTRTKQPPLDPVNAMLSFGYSMLAKDAISASSMVGLDPFAGYLHGERYNQPSLALYLMEEFRPLIVDTTVLALVNRRQLKPEGFSKQLGGAILMDDDTRKIFLRAYEERKRTEVKHPHFATTTNYMYAIEMQARIISKVLLGQIESYIPFIVK